jgi:hypothetical protein
MRRVSLCAWVGLLALSAPATGQLSPSASGFSDAPVAANNRQYWDMMGALGGCLAQQKSAQAAAFVATVIDSSAEGEAFAQLFHPQRNICLGDFVTAGMVRAHARGLVAEGLFERMPDTMFDRFAANPPAAPEVVSTIHDVARCYVIAHPADARELLGQTRVATMGEQKYVQSVAADFAPCLPQGREFTLRPTSMRMAIAEALYRATTGIPAPTIEKAP